MCVHTAKSCLKNQKTSIRASPLQIFLYKAAHVCCSWGVIVAVKRNSIKLSIKICNTRCVQALCWVRFLVKCFMSLASSVYSNDRECSILRYTSQWSYHQMCIVLWKLCTLYISLACGILFIHQSLTLLWSNFDFQHCVPGSTCAALIHRLILVVSPGSAQPVSQLWVTALSACSCCFSHLVFLPPLFWALLMYWAVCLYRSFHVVPRQVIGWALDGSLLETVEN